MKPNRTRHKGLIKGKNKKKIIYFKKDNKTFEISNIIANKITVRHK